MVDQVQNASSTRLVKTASAPSGSNTTLTTPERVSRLAMKELSPLAIGTIYTVRVLSRSWKSPADTLKQSRATVRKVNGILIGISVWVADRACSHLHRVSIG